MKNPKHNFLKRLLRFLYLDDTEDIFCDNIIGKEGEEQYRDYNLDLDHIIKMAEVEDSWAHQIWLSKHHVIDVKEGLRVKTKMNGDIYVFYKGR